MYKRSLDITYANYRVEVTATQGGRAHDGKSKHQNLVQELIAIAKAINSQVDGVDGATARFDTVLVCSHCRQPVQPASAHDEPECCAPARLESAEDAWTWSDKSSSTAVSEAVNRAGASGPATSGEQMMTYPPAFWETGASW